MTKTPTPDRIRLTITVTPEVHASFVRLSKASGISIGRAMGEWLGDTLEAVEFTASKVEQARAAPKLVMQEMHAYALGLSDEMASVLSGLRAKGSPAVGKRSAMAGELPPRPVIRGGKSPNPGKGKRP